MATRNLASNLDNTTSRVVAFFSRREDAYRALSDLKQAGFNSDQIGLAVGHEGETSGNATSTREYDSSFWQKVKDFFSGEDHHEHTDFGEVASPMGWTDDRYEYYQRGISTGGAVVTVTGDRMSEARTILQRDGGDLRESGFESDSSARLQVKSDATKKFVCRSQKSAFASKNSPSSMKKFASENARSRAISKSPTR